MSLDGCPNTDSSVGTISLGTNFFQNLLIIQSVLIDSFGFRLYKSYHFNPPRMERVGDRYGRKSPTN